MLKMYVNFRVERRCTVGCQFLNATRCAWDAQVDVYALKPVTRMRNDVYSKVSSTSKCSAGIVLGKR